MDIVQTLHLLHLVVGVVITIVLVEEHLDLKDMMVVMEVIIAMVVLEVEVVQVA